jgi:chromosomal replication initiator protein
MSYVPVPAAIPNQWYRILGALEKKINRQSYETWLKPTRFSHITGRTLYVRIPSEEFQHIGERYADLIGEAIDVLGLELDQVLFQVPPAEPSVVRTREDGGFAPQSSHSQNAPRRTGAPAGPEQARFDWNTAAQLNPRYQFDGFVTGSGNQFAYAAAFAAAERPGKDLQPSVCLRRRGPGQDPPDASHRTHRSRLATLQAVVSYVTGEKFTNDMINSVRYDKMTGFRDRYRTVDVLLIDDIQFLSGKERTQEEFFHTFNALHELNKQIVVASDRPPKELADFEDRLRSRFEWGLVVDVQPPDLETKVAILQKKAEQEQTVLPTEVALFIAGNVRTNVRELEGALVRLIAWSSLHGVEITLPTAQVCLKQFIDTQVRKITIEAIQRAVAENFGMRVAELKQKNNSRQIVVPRQIAMYLAKQLTEASLPEIGRQFGGKHHTTVMHSISKIDEHRRSDKDLNRTVTKLMETLG